jgi:hypothetical protein
MNSTGKSVCSLEEQSLIRALAQTNVKPDGTPNISIISRETGITRAAIRRIIATPSRDETVDRVQFPSFVTDGDEDEPIHEILARKRKGFERKAKANSDRKWFEIKIKETKPYGVIAFGDPHLDDDGCNIPLLEKHLAIAGRDGMYAINIGDTTNNWVGRLERLYASQEVGKKNAKRLVDWFMFDSGARWLCWVLGNHDVWNEGADFHMRLAQHRIPVIDWRAQFKLVHPNGTEARLDASHGRKGSSIWNNLHATLRAAKLQEMADVFLTGHTHNFGLEHLEIAERAFSCWLVQLRGYKFFDTYALHSNYAEHQMGSSVLVVIDPRNGARTKVQCFEDVELGADYLAWLRR